MDDFNTNYKPVLETNTQNDLQKAVNGTWSCTATASPFGSDPSDDVLSEADLSAVLPAPHSLFMADSIGDGDGSCGTETQRIWQNADFKKAYDGLSCEPNVDRKSMTATVDYALCDTSAATANMACSCECSFSTLERNHPNLNHHSTIIAPTFSRERQAVHLRNCMLRNQRTWLVSWLVCQLHSHTKLRRDKLHHYRFR